MTGTAIREALSRPPVFGDTEQIAALKILRQAEAKKEEKRAEGKKEYKVTVECSWEDTVTVWAADESEAKKMAKEEAEGDFEVYTFHVREIFPT